MSIYTRMRCMLRSERIYRLWQAWMYRRMELWSLGVCSGHMWATGYYGEEYV